MYVTISMLADMLENIDLSSAIIKNHDRISNVRILEGNQTMNKGSLYLIPDTDRNCLLAQTANGSSFALCGDVFSSLNQVLKVLDYYLDWQNKIQKTIEKGCTLAELLNLSYPVIKHPMIILDANEWEIAHSEYSKDETVDQDWEDVITGHSSSPEKITEFNQNYYHYFSLKKVYKIPGEIFGPGYAFNIIYNNSFYGLLLIAEPQHLPEISQGELEAMQYLGELITEMIGANSYDIGSYFPDKPLLECLINKDEGSFERLQRSLKIINWQEADPKIMIYAEPVKGGSLAPKPSRSKPMFNRMDGIVTVEYKTGLIFLCNLRILHDENSAKNKMSEYLRQIAYYAGASSTFCDLADIYKMVDQAYVSFENSSPISGYINFFEYAVVPYLLSIVKKTDANVLKHPCLDILKNYDGRYGSKLYETFFMYIKNERKVARTMQDLDIPRSTLMNRLQKIEELLDVDLESSEVRLYILLSYLLENYSKPTEKL